MTTPDSTCGEKTSSCPACGGHFVCGAEAGLGRCWCMEAPRGVLPPTPGGSCYCPACLERLAAATREGRSG